MKFEDFLMQPTEEKQRRHHHLEEQVAKLEAELEEQQKLNAVLRCTRWAPAVCRHCLSSLLPLQVQVLLVELAMVEEEIIWLERKVEKLRLNLCTEKEHNQQREARPQQEKRILCKHRNQVELGIPQQHLAPKHGDGCSSYVKRGKMAAATMSSSVSIEDASEESTRFGGRSQNLHYIDEQSSAEKPNELSEELIKGLISIFLRLNQTARENDGSGNIPKLTLSCMNSKGFMPKIPSNGNSATNPDPYGAFSDVDGATRDVGPYKNFVQITRSSLDKARVSECFPTIENLRELMLKLCNVDLTFLTYKQKLAFWINIYNGCIMHAFLQHGLPSTEEKLLALMNKAVLNVGGIVLNALAIEHFILRCPCDSNTGPTDEKETLLRQAYGLGYPEPNVTFALCRGSWSSPALRVYTPDEVVNELERAKSEYLEASVGVAIKKKIILPKLLQWHMRDFADDMESLLEWIYSQLPQSGPLKRLMIECLNGGTKCPTEKMVKIQPYESEFRYLMPL